MIHQLFRLPDGSVALQIRCRSHQDAVGWSQFTGNHALRQFDTAPHCSIKMLTNQIHFTVVEMPVGDNCRVPRQKVGQHRHDKMQAERRPHADLQRTGRHAAAAAYPL
ncbi:hypothetical protein D3C72_1449550 [compost metagenome]